MKLSNKISLLLFIFTILASAGSQASNQCSQLFTTGNDVLLKIASLDGRNTKVHVQFESFDPRKETLLVLPELDGSVHTYDATFNSKNAEVIRDKYNIIRVELEGQGQTLRLNSNKYDAHSRILPEDQVHLISQVLVRFKLQKVHLLGFSYSADIATYFAAQHPENISSLILTAPPVHPFMEKDQLNSIYLKLVGDIVKPSTNKPSRLDLKTDPQHWESDAYALASMMREALYNESRAMPDVFEQATQTQVPIRLIRPLRDSLIPQADFDTLSSILLHNGNQNNQVIEINTGHKPPKENPDEYARVLGEALGL